VAFRANCSRSRVFSNLDLKRQNIRQGGGMNLIEWIILSQLVLATTAWADAEVIDDPVLTGMAKDTKTAILNSDSNYILKYVAEEGIYFVDKSYSKRQIIELLKDKNSWLSKHLYSGKSSIKHFFDNNQDIQTKIYKRGENAVMITYASKSTSQEKAVENCYLSIKGTWYLDGIFSCE
jgi:hypothetical protein